MRVLVCLGILARYCLIKLGVLESKDRPIGESMYIYIGS